MQALSAGHTHSRRLLQRVLWTSGVAITHLRPPPPLCAPPRTGLPAGSLAAARTALHTAPQHQTSAMDSSASHPKVYVRMLQDDNAMVISLVLAGKQRNLNRPKDEPLQKALFRLRASLQPANKDKRKKKKRDEGDDAGGAAPEEPVLPINLYQDMTRTQRVSEDALNGDAWASASLLVVGEELFQVVLNAPYVEKVVLPRRPMCGFPLLASAQAEFTDHELTTWCWARRKTGSTAWEEVSRDQLYTPSQEDVGCQLKVTCTPAAASSTAHTSPEAQPCVRYGEPVESISEPVEPAPSTWSARIRCSHISHPAAPPAFRILSYNLLADQYAASTYAQTVLFNYCPGPCLDPDYRCQLILAELLGYQADVFCLQEVDSRLFRDFLVPHLRRHGYAGHYTNKQGKVREGSATFWRTSRFMHLVSCDINLRDVFKLPLTPAHAQWQPMLEASPELTRSLQKVTTIAQMSLLMPVGDQAAAAVPLCVINTHLFFHPYAPHIRSMHTAAILEEASALITRITQSAASHTASPPTTTTSTTNGTSSSSNGLLVLDSTSVSRDSDAAVGAKLAGVAAALGGQQPAVVFCGDLNSDLNDGIPGVVELLQSGRLAPDHWDWFMGASFKWGMNEEDGDEQQQAAAPQPPGSAIAASVAAAKAAADLRMGKTDSAGVEAAQGTQAAAGSVAEAKGQPEGGVSVSVVGVEVQSPFTLRSADDLATPFTNYTSGYKALLDYVWYQPDRLKVVQTHPVPDEATLGSFIPSPTFPSDHLAVIYDLCSVDRQSS